MMFTRIQDLDDIQGAFLRRLLSGIKPFIGPLTPELVAQAHEKHLRGQPGAPVAHASALAVALFVTHGKWKGLCPECSCGVTTGRDWPEARCFECGAILRAVWPADRDAIETELLTRPPTRQHWRPGETLDDLRKEATDHAQ